MRFWITPAMLDQLRESKAPGRALVTDTSVFDIEWAGPLFCTTAAEKDYTAYMFAVWPKAFDRATELAGEATP
jgi:hypothetical protein